MKKRLKYTTLGIMILSTVGCIKSAEESLEGFISRKLAAIAKIKSNAEELIQQNNRKDLLKMKDAMDAIEKTLMGQLKEKFPQQNAQQIMTDRFEESLDELDYLIANYFKTTYFPDKTDREIKTEIDRQLQELAAAAKKLEPNQSIKDLERQEEDLNKMLKRISTRFEDVYTYADPQIHDDAFGAMTDLRQAR